MASVILSWTIGTAITLLFTVVIYARLLRYSLSRIHKIGRSGTLVAGTSDGEVVVDWATRRDWVNFFW